MAQTPSESINNAESQGAPGLDSFFRQDAGNQSSTAQPVSPAYSGIDSFFRQDAQDKRQAAKPAAKPSGAVTASGFADIQDPTQRDNLNRFLTAIGASEGADYNTVVGGGKFSDMSRHPGITGLVTKDGPSTAAGRYQITGTTYRDIASKIGVSDFSAESQDKIAVALLQRRGALDDVLSGNFNSAVSKLGNEWQSLPSGTSKNQGKRTQEFFDKALTLATGASEAQAKQPAASAADPLANAPKWAAVIAKPEYQSMSDADKAGARTAYFQAFVEPGITPAQRGQYRAWFDTEAAKAEEAAQPSAWKSIKAGVSGAIDAAGKLLEPTPDSVMAGAPAGKGVTSPVSPEFNAQFNAAWDAATPNQRTLMAQRPGVLGDLAKARNDQYAKSDAGLAGTSQTTDLLDPRAEARSRRLARNGMAPELTADYARNAAARGVMPGNEVGSVSNSTFDFDAQKKFSEDPFFSNPVVRGAVKGYEGFKVGALGVNQFLGEAVGADAFARTQADAAKASKNYTDGVGESKNYGQRMFEGAISSIAQQVPALIGGALTGSEALVLGSMFAQSFGQEYSAGRSQGQTQGDATLRAGLFGTFEVIGEKFGLGETLKGLRGAVSGMAVKDVSTHLARALLREIPGEELTTLGQFMTDKLPAGVGLNTEAGLAEYLTQAADTLVQTVMQGGMMTSAGAGVAHGVNKFNTPERQIAREIRNAQPGAGNTDAIARAALNPDQSGIAPQDTAKPVAPTATSDIAPADEQVAAPTAQQEQVATADAGVSSQDILDYADSRYRQLRSARDGERVQTMDADGNMADADQSGAGLTADEASELRVLEANRGNADALGKLYGFDQPANVPTPADLTVQHTQAVTDYKDAALSGNEAAAQAAEDKLTQARAEINAANAALAAQVHDAIAQTVEPKTESTSQVATATPEQQALTEKAVQAGIIKPTTLRGEHFRSGIIDATNGIAPQNQSTGYLEGHAWALNETRTTKVAPADSITGVANEAATSPTNDLPQPTDAQKEAGNYRKGHVTLHGLDIAIENPVGSKRSGTDKDGVAWETEMQHHYGYIKGTVGMDKDHIDTFIGTNHDSDKVFVVDQIDPSTGKPDEHKVMLGFDSREQARAAYQANYAKNWTGGKAITETSVEGFKSWLNTGDTKKPFAAPKTEKQAADFRAKQIPDMTDADLAQAAAFYAPDHKRSPKIAKEIAKRAKVAQSAPPVANIIIKAAQDSGKLESIQVGDKPKVEQPAGTLTLRDTFYEMLKAGALPKDNNGLRKVIATFDGKEVSNARLKQGQEDLEAALAQHARGIVQAGGTDKQVFDKLLATYQDQPLLNIRTSTSVENQAYSTPAPLAFVAARLAQIDGTTLVYEPTAGNGMLLLTATPKNATANELESQRFANLKAQGFKATKGDALEQGPAAKSQDAVIANPPFGSVKNMLGDSVKVQVGGFKIGKIDHLIAARALEALQDDGHATLILGADKITGGVSTDDRIFFNWLYGKYNVTSHFEVDGKLYARQGANWPVRVITIAGRQDSKQFSPAPGTIERATTWSEVYGQFEKGLGAQDSAGGKASTAGGEPLVANDSGAAPAADGSKAAKPVSPSQPSGSAAGAGNVGGLAAGTDTDRAGTEPKPLAGRADAVGHDAASAVVDPVAAGGAADNGIAAQRPDSGTARTVAAKSDRKPVADGGLSDPENQFQIPYTPRSSRKDDGVLVPVNMAQPMQDALSTLEDNVGNIDDFAARELGYKNTAELHDGLMGLQVDSVASAIFNIKNGNKATIVADQTGIGKGRQAAAVLRWALKNDYVPVFISVKPSLFTDMYGDLHDIGTDDLAPFIMNVKESISGPNGEKLFANKPGKHKAALASIVDSGKLPEGSNALFLTYSQINVANIQRNALMALGERAVIVMDESHNAAGESATGEYVRGLLNVAPGVVYLSATFAKRPDNMPLYFKTDMGQAITDNATLLDAMASGGLPLQTVISNNLVKAGQMFRRERSYDGVSIETKVDSESRVKHERISDAATEALRAIVDADRRFHEGYFKEIQKQMQESGGSAMDNAGNHASDSVNHTEFSSVVHNFIRQMQLGLKVETVAKDAIAAIQRGEKPIVAVENTMGSFLSEYVDSNGIKDGASLVGFSYHTVLNRALDRTCYLTKTLPNGDKVREYVPLAKLPDGIRAEYQRAQRVIDGLSIDIPASPIDYIRSEIKKAGYSVAEITGRKHAVDYTGKVPSLTKVPDEEVNDKVATTRKFNNGTIDALILNVAGSTGISLHASEKFTDQRQRHMIVAQPAQDINIFMQMLGRIHRTGQVVLPKYTLPTLDLPSEKRPTAILSGKMKSLNANTSSNTESATSIKSSDMLNKYGDQIVTDYLADNPEMALALDLLTAEGKDADADIARKATGRVALLPVEAQHAFYAEIEEQYQALIEYLNKTNQNDLEPRTFDFDAKLKAEATLTAETDPNTPFGAASMYGEYSIKAQGKPMTPAEIDALMKESLGGKKPQEHADALASRLLDLSVESLNNHRALLAEKGRPFADGNIYTPDQIKQNPVTRENYGSMGGATGSGRYFIGAHQVGSLWRLEVNGDIITGVITNIKAGNKATGNPFSMSKIQVTLAVNGPLRSVTIPASQWAKVEIAQVRDVKVADAFRETAETRDTAKIVTGNLLAAYGEMSGSRGSIISFTKSDGTIEQGILLPKIFDMKTNTRGDYVFKSADAALQFLRESDHKDAKQYGIASRDGIVRVKRDGSGIEIFVPKSKAKGGKYFLDKGLTALAGDFTSTGSMMVAQVDAANAKKALAHLMTRAPLYAAPSMAADARAILNDPLPKSASGTVLNDIANLVQGGPLARLEEPKRVATLAKLKSLQNRLDAGKLTAAEFQFGVSQLIGQIQDRNDAKYPARLTRGPAWVIERLMRAKRLDELSGESVDFALWALNKNPALAEDLAISLKQQKEGTAGNYASLLRVITLFKGSSNTGTAVHEILHHSERMMQDFVQAGIAKEWGRAWSKAWKAGDAKVRAALQEMLRASVGDQIANKLMMKAFQNGTLDYDKHYQLVNASEFWAVNATRILSGRYEANGSWIAQAKQWLKELVEKVKGLLGMASDAPALRGLKDVLNGNGQQVSVQLLAERWAGEVKGMASDGDNEVAPEIILNDISGYRTRTESTQKELIKEFGKPTFSNIDWWDKSVGTQFHKAEKNPHFKKVFDLAVKRENAISLTTIRAAEMAPAFLPRTDDFKSAAKTLIKGKSASKQMARAADAIIAGTLQGNSVLEGKVWSVSELRSQFGMDDHGIALYFQARAAINASLDEAAAAEGFAALQLIVPRGLRERVIDDPRNANAILRDAIDKKIRMDELRIRNMERKSAPEAAIERAHADLQNAVEARNTMDKIFGHVKSLKDAGYAPLMRFGKHFVSVEEVDPTTGKTVINEETGAPNTLYFGRFETEGEAQSAYFRQQVAHRGDASVSVKSGPVNDEKYKMYQGVSPETLALFAEAIGAKDAMHQFYQVAISERSALKRRLERKSIAGFSQDMPRVLSNFITSNGRFAAQRYYTRDINSAIKYIPREKGDVQKEAQHLKEYLDNPKDGGAMASSVAFTWFLGGNIASALVNATQPVMMTLPYLTQWGGARAAAALTRAAPYALGKKQITDTELRVALKRAGQEGKVDAQEIFHLYSVGIQGVASALTNKLGKLPLVGGKVKGASEDVRARMTALGTLWGMPFAMVEGFNRRLSFIAAWDVAKATRQSDPYAFAVKAVDATQGIYNKVNRPNWARSTPGRILFTFTQFKIMNVELIKRLATMGGPEGKKAAAMYLAVMILAAGAAGLPYADDIDDVIDTVGQWLGYSTNMKRSKREWAHKILGNGFGDLALYGASAHLPFDFGGRLGLGNILPATGLLKPSGEGNRTRDFLEIGGPAVGGIGAQVFDAYDAASMGDTGKAVATLMPTAIKNAVAGLDMAATGKAKDMKGREKADVTTGEAISKGIGFNPTVVANKNRANMPIYQDLAMQKIVEANVVDLWARGAAKGDQAMMTRAQAKMEDWNRKNPDTPVAITASQITSKARQMLTPTDTRLMKGAPREMRGRVAAGLDMGD